MAALFGAPFSAEAAFLNPEGTTEVISTSTVSGFSRGFDAKGRVRRASTFSKTSLDVFMAHGIRENLTLIATVSSDSIRTKFAGDPGSSMSWNALAGVRVPIWGSGERILSAQALVGAGRDAGRSGIMAEARLLAGQNLAVSGMPGFADLQVAMRQNAPGARPELRFDATFGLKPHQRVMLLAQAFTAYGFASSGQRQSWRIKGQLGLVWHGGETWSVQASAFHTLHGVNTALETGASLSLWRRF